MECDLQYIAHLRDIFIQYLGNGAGNGNGVILFTTDGNAESFLQCDCEAVAGVYATVDCGLLFRITVYRSHPQLT